MREWTYRPVRDFGIPLEERLLRCPREPGMLIYAIRFVANVCLRLLLLLVFRLRLRGRENLAGAGSRILVCNHTSHLDTLCLMAAMPLKKIHRTYPAAASDYFFSDFARSALSTVFMNALPFDRLEGGAESLERCARLLERPGMTLILFPEGTRTTDGHIARFRSGAARLALATGLPVVPCHLAGGFEAWPKGRWLPRPKRLKLHVGEAMRFDDATSVGDICKQLQHAVVDLEKKQ